MAGHDRSPQHQPREDPDDTWEHAHGPYLCFVAAFLRQAVTDARHTPKGTGSWTENTDGGTAGRQREAQAFLLDLNRPGAVGRTHRGGCRHDAADAAPRGGSHQHPVGVTPPPWERLRQRRGRDTSGSTAPPSRGATRLHIHAPENFRHQRGLTATCQARNERRSHVTMQETPRQVTRGMLLHDFRTIALYLLYVST